MFPARRKEGVRGHPGPRLRSHRIRTWARCSPCRRGSKVWAPRPCREGHGYVSTIIHTVSNERVDPAQGTIFSTQSGTSRTALSPPPRPTPVVAVPLGPGYPALLVLSPAHAAVDIRDPGCVLRVARVPRQRLPQVPEGQPHVVVGEVALGRVYEGLQLRLEDVVPRRGGDPSVVG